MTLTVGFKLQKWQGRQGINFLLYEEEKAPMNYQLCKLDPLEDSHAFESGIQLRRIKLNTPLPQYLLDNEQEEKSQENAAQLKEYKLIGIQFFWDNRYETYIASRWLEKLQ